MLAPSLSLCMIVKNEEENLKRCLDSVIGVIDELIIVDTGSTDHTPEIAQAYQAKLYYHEWKNDFSEARNVSLEKATGEWILVLDGDEMLTPESRQRLKPILATVAADGVLFKVRNFNPPDVLSEYNDSPQIRAFRNRPQYRYQQRVHNQIGAAIAAHGGVIENYVDDLMIWHYGYVQRTVQGNQDRLERSLRMLEAAVNEEPQNIYLNSKLAVIYFHLGEHSLAYTYAYRVLTELDHSQLTVENLRDILRIVSSISIQRGYYDLAVQTAQTCLDLSQDDVDALLSALDLLGVAYGAQAELCIKRAVAIEHQLVKMGEGGSKTALNEQRVEWLKKGKEATAHSEKAFKTLLGHPQLRISHKERVQQRLDHSRTLHQYIEKRMAWQP